MAKSPVQHNTRTIQNYSEEQKQRMGVEIKIKL